MTYGMAPRPELATAAARFHAPGASAPQQPQQPARRDERRVPVGLVLRAREEAARAARDAAALAAAAGISATA